MATNSSITAGSRTESGSGTGVTVITKGTKLTGDLSLAGVLHLDGYLEGNLLSSSDISVGVNGQINGDIVGEKIYVSGKVKGNITAKLLQIMGGGEVVGSVQVGLISVEKGGIMAGEVTSAKPREILD